MVGGEREGAEEVVCNDVTTSPVRFASRVSAATHLKSRVSAVIQDSCGCTVTSKIGAGCKMGHVDISCCEYLFRKYE